MHEVTLQEPIKRGEETVTKVSLTKPRAGAMRGLAITDLLRMEVAAISTLLPRITMPSLSAAEVADLDPADLMAFSEEVVGFFMTTAQAEAAGIL